MKKNPKALNLELLEVIEKPVTLGFKVNPDVKLKLAKDATQFGMSLSMYVKNILTDKHRFYKNELEELYKSNKILNERIQIYENETLKSLYSRHRGKNLNYRDNNGENREIIINDIVDVHNIIINSFKSI
jgi:hypothetical protein